MKQKSAKIISLALMMAAAVLLMPLEQKLLGYSVWALGVLSLLFAERGYTKHIVLIYFSLAVLGITPINTDISPLHMLVMAATLLTAVAVPYIVTKYIYKESVITYPFKKHKWTRGHYGYLLLTAVIGYLLLPFWMSNTGGYMNWSVPLDPAGITLLLIGTNGLGIWDELFFIITVLALLRRHLPFIWANAIQAVLFTAFLYELGFRGWAPLAIYPFALLQGVVYKKTHNLLYIIAIHLTLDLVLFLALINAHHPQLIDIFITK